MASGLKALALTLAAVVLGGMLGTWVYDHHKQKTYRASVVALLQDASQRMQEALTLEAGLPAEGRMGTGRQLEQHAAAVAGDLQKAVALDRTSDRKLADAADAYLVNVREILHNQAASNRHRISLTKSLAEVRANDLAAREYVDAAYRDYRASTDAFGTMLDALGAAERKIAPYVDASLLSDPRLIEAARSRTIDALGEAAAEMEQAKQRVSVR